MTTDPTRAAEIVVASKEARSAAADLYLAQQGEPHSPHDLATAEAIRSGLNDHWEVVQAFARFERDHMQRPTDTARAGEDAATVKQPLTVRISDDELDRPIELSVVSWEGRLHCCYLNDFRIAGGKPWGGGSTAREWKTTLREVIRAFPVLQKAVGLNYLGKPIATPSPVTDETVLSGEVRLLYEGSVIDAVQKLLERGKATVDSDGYLTLASTPQPASEVEKFSQDEWDKGAQELIRKAAELIKPASDEVVFYVRVGGDHTHLTTHAGAKATPHKALNAAIKALEAEKEDAERCPVHVSIPQPAAAEMVERAVAAERERCANAAADVFDRMATTTVGAARYEILAAIRQSAKGGE